MANRFSLNSQLSFIMETMARSALSQVCKVVEKDASGLRSELARLQAANTALTEKVSSLECEITVVRNDARQMCKSSRSVGVQTSCTDSEQNESPTIEAIFGKDWCINLWKDRDPDCSESSTEDAQAVDKSGAVHSDQIAVTVIKEEDFVEGILDSYQQETPREEDHGESMTDEPLSVGPSGESSSCSLSLDQDGEKSISEEPSIQLISAENPEEAFATHVIPIGEDDDDDVLFIPDSQTEPMINTSELNNNEQQISEHDTSFSKGQQFGINMYNYQTAAHSNRYIFKCEICDRTFFHKGTLTHHMKTHKENFCSICKQHFPHWHKFKRHTCVPPYSSKSQSCNLCGKAFANPSALRIHQVVHTGEKPYSCSFCGKGFTQKGNLNAHLRIHTGERPFCCLKCGKTFTQKINLKHHMMAHIKSDAIQKN
ncbi:uncharacterized protein LOC141810099 [Halichoeres trimaculatus]|uniref:uncharacterized protein LOC141810099 n=1 Tax=Halichoeres trimaculatus TaxID=147232 RepID=UPI003D9E6FD5